MTGRNHLTDDDSFAGYTKPNDTRFIIQRICFQPASKIKSFNIEHFTLEPKKKLHLLDYAVSNRT